MKSLVCKCFLRDKTTNGKIGSSLDMSTITNKHELYTVDITDYGHPMKA